MMRKTLIKWTLKLNQKQLSDTKFETMGHNPEIKEPQTETTSIGRIMGITIGVIILVIFLLVVAVVYRKWLLKAKDEEPKIDQNMYYGVDYDDNDADNAITDTNDYYD